MLRVWAQTMPDSDIWRSSYKMARPFWKGSISNSNNINKEWQTCTEVCQLLQRCCVWRSVNVAESVCRSMWRICFTVRPWKYALSLKSVTDQHRAVYVKDYNCTPVLNQTVTPKPFRDETARPESQWFCRKQNGTTSAASLDQFCGT